MVYLFTPCRKSFFFFLLYLIHYFCNTQRHCLRGAVTSMLVKGASHPKGEISVSTYTSPCDVMLGVGPSLEPRTSYAGTFSSNVIQAPKSQFDLKMCFKLFLSYSVFAAKQKVFSAPHLKSVHKLDHVLRR